MFILSRKNAFKLAWQIFWLATGTRRVGIRVQQGYVGTYLELVGHDLIDKEENAS